MSGITFTLAITSPACMGCPASFIISVMMPEICGFTFTSLRGSMRPVITVVFFRSLTLAVSSVYCSGWGCDLAQRNTNVPTNTMAISTATMIFFFITSFPLLAFRVARALFLGSPLLMFLCLIVLFRYGFWGVCRPICHSSRMASTGLMFMARNAGASPASTPSTQRNRTAPTAVVKLIW